MEGGGERWREVKGGEVEGGGGRSREMACMHLREGEARGQDDIPVDETRRLDLPRGAQAAVSSAS